ncbi:MAG TPA: tannase/feruloyl esterase family alpha/beta hydrolase [Woeseiaceae bacterium]|nr:tannase/feruloyl esterase family alpha/beta hydrolase [Woeseiaceae bacterium]
MNLRDAIFLSILLCSACTDDPVNPNLEADDNDTGTPTFSARCSALTDLALEAGKIVAANWTEESPFSDLSDDPNGPTTPIPAHCTVRAKMTPTSNSDINIEIWLPADGWNGRFLGVGNGGYAGDLNVSHMAIALQRGYATATTDTGHGLVGTEVWVPGNPEKVEDYGHRAIHLAAVVGKRLVAVFYGSPPEYSYFSSCSNGGRQALMEAVRYPDDYDGIIAGAPAADLNGLLIASMGRNAEILHDTPIDQSMAVLISDAVIKQCDVNDGVADGVIASPPACDFDASSLACTTDKQQNCLTPAQVEALTEIRAPRLDSEGRYLGAGFSVGGESSIPPSGGWGPWILGSREAPSIQWSFFHRYMQDFLMENPDWSIEDFDLERDIAHGRSKLGAVLDANDPNLSAFAESGGKLIIWHGWSDAAIPARSSIHLFESMIDEMGDQAVGDFARLYMAPGVHHCAFGPGPWSFNPLAAVHPLEPRRDMAATMERWVENGVAPAELIAVLPKDPMAAFRGDYPVEAEKEGLLCPYPEEAHYAGAGDPALADSYECRN